VESALAPQQEPAQKGKRMTTSDGFGGHAQTQGEPERLRITFKAANPRDEHALVQSGAIAIEQAIDALDSEGVKASVEAQTASGDGSRAIGVDDVLVSILANAITALLFQVITNLTARIRHERARSPQRAQQNEQIVLQMGDKKATFPVNISADALRSQLAQWTHEAKPSGDVQISLEQA